MKKYIFIRIMTILFIFASWVMNGKGQVFTIIDSLPDGAYGAAAWGDLDNDGYKDLVYLSQAIPNDFCNVYHNIGNVFTKVPQHFPVLFNPAVRWADLDNDGFDDLVMNGLDSTLHNRTFIYRSNGDGSFTPIANSIFPLAAGSIDVADYNNDGWKDIAITGFDSVAVEHAFIYKNLGGFVFVSINASLFGVHFGELKWGDYNNDSLPDLVINGIGSFDYRTRIYKNMGNDVFELQPFYMKGSSGTVDWMDNNTDGWLDLLVTGVDSTSGHNFTELHHNNGDGTFSLAPTNLPSFGEPSGVAVADFNNDGFPDICFTGGSEQFPNVYSAMAMGQGDSIFNVNAFYQGNVENPLVETIDIDGDGDTDLFFRNLILRNDLVPNAVSRKGHSEKVSVFPNPGADKIFIRASVPVAEVIISTIQGRFIKDIRMGTPVKEVKLEDLSAGIYLAQVHLSGNETIPKKIIVIRN